MSTSVWDDPELAVGGDFVKFDAVGDTISGTIGSVRSHRFDDGKVVPQILITTDDGDERTITAGQTRLKIALVEQRPEAGDHIKITLTQIEKRAGGKTLKHFDLEVRTAGAAAPVAAAVEAPAVTNPAAAAAALANLTPEQKKALGLA